MQFPRILLVAALFGPGAAPAQADSPQSLEITVKNSGRDALDCNASIAHWFSEDIGRIAPGESLSFSFGYALESGTIFRLNDVGDEMAVERIWCGKAGEDWATRAEIAIDRRAGKLPGPVSLSCVVSGDETLCEAL
ncbi:hypothetical protein [Oricola sp.]|uniref:hypothetical protein n=1 Tax=Oricola sp. TaxID=1979950 RepID=UPI003BA945A3